MNKSGKALATMLLVGFSSLVAAGGWTEPGKVTMVYVKPDRNGVYFQHDDMISGGCSKNSHYFLDADQNLFKETYSLLLAAYSAGKLVRINVSGCQPNYGHPLIRWVNAE